MKKILSLLGAIIMFDNGASIVTANKVQEPWQNNNSQQKDKTYLI
ncbi:hypothetical protein [Spiroplasma endosymbiont of Poecilobothrus nobilitatus]